jgi:starvation-inducible DNA-binding protein
MTTTPMPQTAATVAETLNARLADLVDLHWQAKQAHWNVTGANFIAVHEMLDDDARIAREMADTVAERVRALKAPAEGTVRTSAARSALPEFPLGEVPWEQAVSELLLRYEQLSEAFRKAAEQAAETGDVATEDLYVGFIREVDQRAYFLRSHL